jgi:hypothetical protein
MKKTDRRKTSNKAEHLKKAPELKKHPITIYESGVDIDAIGGVEAARQVLKNAFQIALNGATHNKS